MTITRSCIRTALLVSMVLTTVEAGSIAHAAAGSSVYDSARQIVLWTQRTWKLGTAADTKEEAEYCAFLLGNEIKSAVHPNAARLATHGYPSKDVLLLPVYVQLVNRLTELFDEAGSRDRLAEILNTPVSSPRIRARQMGVSNRHQHMTVGRQVRDVLMTRVTSRYWVYQAKWGWPNATFNRDAAWLDERARDLVDKIDSVEEAQAQERRRRARAEYLAADKKRIYPGD